MRQIGFIGTGNMGFPMMKGAIARFGAENVTYTSAHIEKMEQMKQKTGVDYVSDNRALIEEVKYIVLCVKPQYMEPVYEELRSCDLSGKILISVIAGASVEAIREKVGQRVKVVRSMPNTPALVSEGMTTVCFSDSETDDCAEAERFTDEERSFVREFFSSFGKYVELPEKLIDAAMCANGCAPAFVYMFIEALADGAVKYGIPRQTAYELVAQTVLGSAKMVLETGEHPGTLKDRVCSPGGTTIAGVAALEEAGMRSAMIKATDACFARAQEIARK